MSELIDVYRDYFHYLELTWTLNSHSADDMRMYCYCLDDIKYTHYYANLLYYHLNTRKCLSPDTVQKYLDELYYRDSRLKFTLSLLH